MSDNPRLKVLHIIHGFGTGGAETWLLEVARYLQRHPELGVRIDFLLTGGEKQHFDDEILRTGARIFYLKYSFRHPFSFRKGLLRVFKEERYDVVHDHQDFISGFHFLLGLGALPPKRIAHLHNPYNFVRNYVSNPGRWLLFKLGRLFMVRLSTAITGTSDAVMDEYGYDRSPFKEKRVAPAYCGIDMDAFLFDPESKKRIFSEMNWDEQSKLALFVGRIGLESFDIAANQKNPEFAFSLAKYIVTQDVNWKFVFAGVKGSLGEQMEDEVRREGLADRIRFTGIRRDVPALMSAANVLVFPSLWEGLGMVAVEAQASGLSIVMSATVPQEAVIIPELVKRISLQEPITTWYDAMRSEDKGMEERMACNEKATGTPFSIEGSVRYLISLYTNKSSK